MRFWWLSRRLAARAAAKATAIELVEAFGGWKAWHDVSTKRRELPSDDIYQGRHLAEVTKAIERLTGYTR